MRMGHQMCSLSTAKSRLKVKLLNPIITTKKRLLFKKEPSHKFNYRLSAAPSRVSDSDKK